MDLIALCVLMRSVQRRNASSLRYHAPYVKLLLLAIQELMSLPAFAYEGVGYRGLKLDGNDELTQKFLNYKTAFVVGQLITFAAFMSVSTDDSVAELFGDYVFFVFVKVRGARIAVLSQIPKEAEILVPPPSVFRIKAVAKFGGRLAITLEQEICPLSYMSHNETFSATAAVDIDESSLGLSLLAGRPPKSAFAVVSAFTAADTRLKAFWKAFWKHSKHFWQAYKGTVVMTFVVLGLTSFVAFTAWRYGLEGVYPYNYNCATSSVYSGSCSDIPTRCYDSKYNYPNNFHQICTMVSNSSYSCSWPSWLRCGLCTGNFAFQMNFNMPDYEKGACVNKNGLSLWQFVGLVVGGTFCLSVWFVSVWRLKPATFWFFAWLIFYAMLFGLIFGLGSSRLFRIPSGDH
jgi:hypothetical protein